MRIIEIDRSYLIYWPIHTGGPFIQGSLWSYYQSFSSPCTAFDVQTSQLQQFTRPYISLYNVFTYFIIVKPHSSTIICWARRIASRRPFDACSLQSCQPACLESVYPPENWMPLCALDTCKLVAVETLKAVVNQWMLHPIHLPIYLDSTWRKWVCVRLCALSVCPGCEFLCAQRVRQSGCWWGIDAIKGEIEALLDPSDFASKVSALTWVADNILGRACVKRQPATRALIWIYILLATSMQIYIWVLEKSFLIGLRMYICEIV